MPDTPPVPLHITTTETFVRLYVLLSQYLDRCLDDTMRESLSEKDFQGHLFDTHQKVKELLASNRVVKDKVENEFQTISRLGADFLDNPQDKDLRTHLKKEREILRVKMLALSDLLAVFRSV